MITEATGFPHVRKRRTSRNHLSAFCIGGLLGPTPIVAQNYADLTRKHAEQ